MFLFEITKFVLHICSFIVSQSVGDIYSFYMHNTCRALIWTILIYMYTLSFNIDDTNFSVINVSLVMIEAKLQVFENKKLRQGIRALQDGDTFLDLKCFLTFWHFKLKSRWPFFFSHLSWNLKNWIVFFITLHFFYDLLKSLELQAKLTENLSYLDIYSHEQ